MLTRIPELENKIVYASENRYLAWEYIGEALLKKNAWDHAFCPDCVVYGAKKMLYLSDDFSRGDIVSFMEKYGMPTLICYRRNIYIVAESVRKAQEIENVMSFSAQVQMANAEQGMNYLSDAKMEELLNWDSEKYRRLRCEEKYYECYNSDDGIRFPFCGSRIQRIETFYSGDGYSYCGVDCYKNVSGRC